MGALGTYRLRLERKRRLVRSLRKSRELNRVANRTGDIADDDILIFSTVRNERIRLPFFLDYYRKLGVNHFLFVDNGSDDGTREYLESQADVSLWTTSHSYKRAKFGIDWLNALQLRYGIGHWNLVVDVDEFLVYPFCDSRPLRALTDWLDASSVKSFGAMLVTPRIWAQTSAMVFAVSAGAVCPCAAACAVGWRAWWHPGAYHGESCSRWHRCSPSC